MVLLGHPAGYLVDRIPGYQTEWFAPLLVPFGFPWVWLFLVISGFLLCKAFVTGRFRLNRLGVLSFYLSRARRLVPLLWFLSFSWLVLYRCGLWPTQLPSFDSYREIGIDLLLPWVPYFQSTQAIASMDSPVWSVVVEVHFCLVLPLLLLSGKRLSVLISALIAWVLFIAFIIVSVSLTGRPEIFPITYGAHFYNFGFFVTGMLLALLPKSERLRVIPWPVAIGAAVLALIGAQYATYWSINITLAVAPLVFCPLLAVLVGKADDTYQVKLATRFSGLWGGRHGLRWLERIGMMSYSVYLSHKPISYIVAARFGAERLVSGYLTYLCVLAMIVPVVLAFSSVLFIGVENRFRQKKRPPSPVGAYVG